MSPTGPRALWLLVLLLFFVSGATGLVYEVAWTRRLLLLLGSTSAASALVLAAFLGGLGLGALFGGRWADRTKSPLRLYGILEIAGAVWALLLPFLLTALTGPYVAAAGAAGPSVRASLRAALAVVAVVPGALAVGATFPALMRALATDRERLGRRTVLLYGANTLGAVAGALWAGFVGIFDVGVMGSTRVAAGIAAAVGVLAILVSLVPGSGREPALRGKPLSVPRGPLVIAAFSGFLALGLEAAGVRILVFFVEGFTTSFAAMLATFLAGLGLGSLVLGPWLANRRRPELVTGALLVATGLLVVGASYLLPSFEEFLRGVRDRAYGSRAPAAAQRWTALVGSAVLFFPPSLLLGAVFPLTVRWAALERVDDVGRVSGRVALVNSLGAVFGPLAVFLLASTGAQNDRPGGPLLAWGLLGLLAIAAGVARLLFTRGWLGKRALPVAGIAAGLALGLLAPMVISTATPEALVRASRVLRTPQGRIDPQKILLAVRSDSTVTASIVETPPADRTLYTDEFAAASTGRSYTYMRMLGHLPVFAAANPENAFVIAFGTGTTAAALAAHSDVRRLEIVETSRAVLGLAPWFEAVNRGVLDDPRVIRRVEDGRNALQNHRADLDVITLEPLMPYTPAALPFYTRDFYELAKAKLRDGGVLCQWVPVHAMPVDLYAALVGTFFDTFPEGSIWYFEQSTILIGHKGDARPDAAAIQARATEVARHIQAAGFSSPALLPMGWLASGSRVLDVLANPEHSSQEAIRASPPGPLARRIVTDERPFPEAYPTPRAGLLTTYLPDTLLWLSGLVSDEDDPGRVAETGVAPLEAMPTLRLGAAQAMLARATEANAEWRQAHSEALRASSASPAALEEAAQEEKKAFDGRQEALRLYGELMAGPGPEDRNIQRRHVRLRRLVPIYGAEHQLALLRAARARGDDAAAKDALAGALYLSRGAWDLDAFDPLITERPRAAALFAESLLRAGKCAEADEFLSEVRRMWPWNGALGDLAALAAAKRHGREKDLGARFESLKALVDALPACNDEASAAVRPLVVRLQVALREHRAQGVRSVAELILAQVKSASIPPEDVARVVRETGDLTQPELEAERAALLAALTPADPGLASMLADTIPERWKAALHAAAGLGFDRTRSRETVDAQLVRSPSAERRLAFIALAVSEGSRGSLERLVALLDDPDEEVRTAAWQALGVRMPADKKTAVNYDPKASEQDRRAARDRAGAWVAELR